MKGIGYLLIIVALALFLVGLFIVAKPFGSYVRGNWPSMVLAVSMTLLGTFVGAFLALGIAWETYRDTLAGQRDRLMAALYFETAETQALLRKVVERQEWRKSAVGTSYPTAAVAESALNQSALFQADTDRGLVHAVMHYRSQVDAVRRTMEFMHSRFVAEGGSLSTANLETLDRICRNALAASYALQDCLDAYSEEHRIVLGHQEQFKAYKEILDKEMTRVDREVIRPDSSGPAIDE